jgi:hypothetical protein
MVPPNEGVPPDNSAVGRKKTSIKAPDEIYSEHKG